MPALEVRRGEIAAWEFFVGDIDDGFDTVPSFNQIGMGKETGVDECDRDPASAEARIGIES